MSTKREQIVATTCTLMETQGYHATGLNQILAASGAPKGSLYHYFPGGKEELAVSAVERSSCTVARYIETQLAAHADPAVAMTALLYDLANYVAASNYAGGAPITAIALEAAATHEPLRLACEAAYARWQAVIAAKLTAGGIDAARSARLATVIIAAIEGTIALCRCRQSVEPLHQVAAEIEQLVRAARSDSAAHSP
jgi:TetR/AcrR family transcriptional repressor of lmrAB and yxaGH operons